ncbi:hypothetical protein U0070_019924 [Myodes glareolus]|uniref:Uncharacterized protein n=1 Tax=Myodes glareolus TaxID=447135 RepID=A0AAW0JKA5_MYOGA
MGVYEIRLQTCTALGCASSDWASTQITEVPSLMQPAQHLEPNGKTIDFELYRRQIETHPGKTSPLLAYSGSFSSFTDLELLPFTEYEYQGRTLPLLFRLRLQLCQPWPPDSAPPCPPSHTEGKYGGPGHRADLMERQPTGHKTLCIHPQVPIATTCALLPRVPQYQAPFSVDSNESTECVNCVALPS